MRKITLVILIMSLVLTNAYSQEKIAVAGAGGIFITLGKDIPNESATSYNVKSYKIYRKVDNAADWSELSNTEAIKDLAEFKTSNGKIFGKAAQYAKIE